MYESTTARPIERGNVSDFSIPAEKDVNFNTEHTPPLSDEATHALGAEALNSVTAAEYPEVTAIGQSEINAANAAHEDANRLSAEDQVRLDQLASTQPDLDEYDLQAWRQSLIDAHGSGRK